MQPIHPISEKSCKSLCGKSVLLLLNDGSQVYGVLSRLDKNKLVLNDEARPKLSTKTMSKKGKKTAKAKSTQENAVQEEPAFPVMGIEPVRLSFFGGLPFFGGPAPAQEGPIDIPLNQVAAMFSE
ncbi:hypothetical protein [Bacillus sp. 3255]|nr:hypothetical protein [Bacillus sp. 3255]MDR6881711.1 small nuclear ribonucleoprotein (snRNP)-like protein [Bacillus sp. 3255]